ncbi:MAG: V-type ATP synthase subunit E [Christensenellaceae bacterium]|nr:V-type ATP synthase subunit E [Christensenellaceae bacterium]
MSDTLTIAERIINDAENIAKSTIEEGTIKANSIIDYAQMQADLYQEHSNAECEKLADEIIRRKQSAAAATVRKLILKAKKEAIDQAFARAEELLASLSRTEYLALIKSLLSIAEDGDTLYRSVKDKRVITKTFVDSCMLGTGIKIEMGNPDDFTVKSGIVLVSKNANKDCTLASELDLLRTEIESEVASILFPET